MSATRLRPRSVAQLLPTRLRQPGKFAVRRRARRAQARRSARHPRCNRGPGGRTMTNTRCPILVALLLSLAAPGCSAGTIPGRELDAPRTQTDLREALRGGWVVTASRAERGDWERAERESLLELGPSGRLGGSSETNPRLCRLDPASPLGCVGFPGGTPGFLHDPVQRLIALATQVGARPGRAPGGCRQLPSPRALPRPSSASAACRTRRARAKPLLEIRSRKRGRGRGRQPHGVACGVVLERNRPRKTA